LTFEHFSQPQGPCLKTLVSLTASFAYFHHCNAALVAATVTAVEAPYTIGYVFNTVVYTIVSRLYTPYILPCKIRHISKYSIFPYTTLYRHCDCRRSVIYHRVCFQYSCLYNRIKTLYPLYSTLKNTTYFKIRHISVHYPLPPP